VSRPGSRAYATDRVFVVTSATSGVAFVDYRRLIWRTLTAPLGGLCTERLLVGDEPNADVVRSEGSDCQGMEYLVEAEGSW
jgi:hypothetical protein